MISADQVRAARILVGMGAAELAQAAGVGIATVKRIESGQTVSASTVEKIANALSDAGISFLSDGDASADGGVGVRLSNRSPRPQ